MTSMAVSDDSSYVTDCSATYPSERDVSCTGTALHWAAIRDDMPMCGLVLSVAQLFDRGDDFSVCDLSVQTPVISGLVRFCSAFAFFLSLFLSFRL